MKENHEILNMLLQIIEPVKSSTREKFSIVKETPENLFGISHENMDNYNMLLAILYQHNKSISEKFSRQTFFKFMENDLFKHKRLVQKYNESDNETFFKPLNSAKPTSKYIIAPISGIRLDNNDSVDLSIFKIGKTSKLQSLISNDPDGYYIATKINQFYDNQVAIEQAKELFLDFIRIITFIAGREDKSVLIKIGLPSYASLNHEKIYTSTSSYQIVEELNCFPEMSIENKYVEKIPVDDSFFSRNDDFNKIFTLIEKRHNNNKLSDMEKRLLNSAIAIGESMCSKNIKNSILYTSMAIEILFSYQERDLYQLSIGDKLADAFAFMVGVDKETRLNARKGFKDFYRLRSGLVHGGKTSTTNEDYILMNQYVRMIIREFFTNDKYSGIKDLEQFNQMILEAKNSY